MEIPKIENYSLNKGVNIQDYISDLNLFIDQEKAEKKELIKELEQTISNLESKQKAFLGTNGETARANFKLGLGWAIEAFKTIVDNIK